MGLKPQASAMLAVNKIETVKITINFFMANLLKRFPGVKIVVSPLGHKAPDTPGLGN
jgi:hypothetical protein